MFKGLRETIKNLNADVKNVANSQKAKKLRKTLLSIGLPLAIIGLIGVFVCFILFVSAGKNAFGENGFTSRILVPFILLIPFFFVAAIGFFLSSIGFSIVVTGYTTELVDETIGNKCPNCKETIELESQYCGKCGAKVKKICPNCDTVNSYKNCYCEKCGTKLD